MDPTPRPSLKPPLGCPSIPHHETLCVPRPAESQHHTTLAVVAMAPIRTVTSFPRLILEYYDQIPVQTKFQECRLFDHFCRVSDHGKLLLPFDDRLPSLLFFGPGREYTRREEAAPPLRKTTS